MEQLLLKVFVVCLLMCLSLTDTSLKLFKFIKIQFKRMFRKWNQSKLKIYLEYVRIVTLFIILIIPMVIILTIYDIYHHTDLPYDPYN